MPMSKRSVSRRLATLATAFLLAALAGCLMRSQGPSPSCCLRFAAPAVEGPKQKPVAEVGGFGVRPASILRKSGLAAAEVPFLRRFREAVGVEPKDVEAFAVLDFVRGGDEAGRVLLVRTSGDVPQGNVMTACQAGAPTKMACGAKVYTGESGLAVHFPQKRLALIADGVETMARCLTQLPELISRLGEAAEHDLTAWIYPAALPEPLKDGPAPIVGKVKMGRMWADLGLTFDAGVEADFTDEASAKVGKKVFAAGRDFGAGGVLMGAGYVKFFAALPELMAEEMRELVHLAPLGLFRRAENGLREARVEVKGKTALLTFCVPLAPDDGAALKKLFAHKLAAKVDECAGRPGLVFEPGNATGRGKCEPQEADALPPPPPCLGAPMPVSEGAVIRLPKVTADSADVPEKRPLAVVNLRKEDVVLFTVDDKGELTFVAKAPQGEAIDLDARQGQKWVAVFLSEPFREAFTVSGDRAVWLLRAPKVNAPCYRGQVVEPAAPSVKCYKPGR
jgi:hypothetical protein